MYIISADLTYLCLKVYAVVVIFDRELKWVFSHDRQTTSIIVLCGNGSEFYGGTVGVRSNEWSVCSFGWFLGVRCRVGLFLIFSPDFISECFKYKVFAKKHVCWSINKFWNSAPTPNDNHEGIDMESKRMSLCPHPFNLDVFISRLHYSLFLLQCLLER